MSENKLPDLKAPAEIRPNKRDLGFVLIGLALGLCWDSVPLPFPFILILAMGVAVAGAGFIRSR